MIRSTEERTCEPAGDLPGRFFYGGSSPHSGERGVDVEEEVLVTAEAVGHALDDLDLVGDALEHDGVSRIAAMRPQPRQVGA